VKTFSDTMSRVRRPPRVATLTDYVRGSDTVVVWTLDRLGSNTHVPGQPLAVSSQPAAAKVLGTLLDKLHSASARGCNAGGWRSCGRWPQTTANSVEHSAYLISHGCETGAQCGQQTSHVIKFLLETHEWFGREPKSVGGLTWPLPL
jgi:hypothetical protein